MAERDEIKIKMEQDGDNSVQIGEISGGNNVFNIYDASSKTSHINKGNTVCIDDSTWFITNFKQSEGGSIPLKDAYIPNSYSVSSSKENNDDLLDFINRFANDSLSYYKSLNNSECEARTLIIRGYQGVGKSSLLSKISYEWSCGRFLSNKNIYFTSFKKICDGVFDVNFIKNNANGLHPILFIDALDEGGFTENESVNYLNDITDCLSSCNCKVIATCRHNFINASDIRMSIEIALHPFSMVQAHKWLELYSLNTATLNVDSIMHTLNMLDEEIKEIILIPYIFYTCIEKNIDFMGITGLGKLYDLLFSGINADAAITRYNYNKSPRHNTRSWKMHEETIEKLAILFFHDDNHSISEEKLAMLIEDKNIPLSQLATEFYLKKIGTMYRFVHNSIHEYFAAKKIVYHINYFLKARNIEAFLHDMTDIIGNIKSINLSTLEFVSHFIVTHTLNIDSINEAIILVLKNWTKVHFISSENDDVFEVLEKVQNRFVVIMNIFLEYLKKCGKKSNALQMLSENEIELFVKNTRFNERAFDFIKWFNITGLDLRNINLRGTNLAGQLLNGLQLSDADLRNVRLTGGYFRNVDFSNSDMRDCDCKNADFHEAVLTGVDFRKARLSGASFYGADLMFADLRGASLLKTDLRGVNLLNSKISSEQLGFIPLDDIERYNINVYHEDRLMKFRAVIELYKNKFPVQFACNYQKLYGTLGENGGE